MEYNSKTGVFKILFVIYIKAASISNSNMKEISETRTTGDIYKKGS